MEQVPGADSYYDPQLGMTITWSGRARVRRLLQQARERHTPEQWAAMRRQLGFPERPAPFKEVVRDGVVYRLPSCP